MKKILLILPLLILAFIYSDTVQAQDVDYARPAWYVSVSGSFDVHLFENEIENAFDGIIDVKNAWGIDVKIGRRVLKWLSLEAEYEYVNGFDINVEDITIFKIPANTLTGNIKLHYPIQRFIPYVTAGIGGTWYNIKDQFGLGIGFESGTAFAGRVGGGLDIFLTEHWAINANYTFVLTTFDLKNPTQDNNISDIHYGALQVGIAYYF